MPVLNSEADIVAETFTAQETFINAVFSGEFRWLLFGGAIRAGKTVVLMLIAITLCKIYPKSRWICLMHDRPTISRTVLPTFFKVCPSNFLEDFNGTNLIATFTNGSQLIFMSEQFEKDPELNRFKSLEANGFFCPQMEGLSEPTFDMMIQRSGQWAIDPMPPQLIIGDCNPTHGWIKEKFYKPWHEGKLKPGYYFQPADINDNPYISVEYKESLKDMAAPLYKQFVKGSWDATDALNQLVAWSTINACENKLIDTVNTDKEFYLGVDVGHLGSDKSVFLLMQGYNVIDITELEKKDTVEVAEKVKQYMAGYSIKQCNVVIDVVGVGAGVYDKLYHEKFYQIVAFRGGSSEFVNERVVGTEFKFAHWKAWSYWVAAEEMKAGHVGGFGHDKLKTDCAAIWYYIRGDRVIWTESKEDLRKRIGRSCDHWDAFTYAVWARMQHKLMGDPGMVTMTQIRREQAAQRQKEAANVS